MPPAILRRARLRRALAATVTAALIVVAGVVGTAAPAQAATSGWLSTSGSRVVTSSGSAYTIKATAWFGMETPNCTPHGLWSISLDSGLARIAAMGFNTIRLPFSNECLAAKSSNSINAQVNPKLVSLTPLKLMDTVIARAKAHGLNVILDRHRPDSGSQSELWYTDRYSEKRWISDWTMLAKRYRTNSTVIGFDLHNEPHGAACWGCGDAKRDWRAAATRAGNAVLAVNPRLLIIVEGVERESDGTSTWWGGGLRGVRTKPVTLAVNNRVVYSPHDYPATVYPQSWFSASNYPANLPAIWERNWGYIQTKGIAPVLLGEFGTKYETSSDRKWLKTLVRYLDARRMGFMYWSFNPNSGDTGGLVKDDWVTPQKSKLAVLAPILGESATPKPAPTASSTPKPTPTKSSTPTPAPSPSASSANAAGLRVTYVTQSAWADGYVAQIAVTGVKKAAKSWSVSWRSPGITGIVNSWGLSCSIASSVVTCRGSDWAALVAAGQTVNVGLQAAASSAPANPVITVRSKLAS
ncbi:cellulase family glycosylhydrolase [Microbacterium terricola]|uniref:Endoglucanase n=1 Tax=Microbacterium terricola TaxID=344163 RepID=A0ABM8DW65_9MICO|nr:cellulase family glycosylhydrolase [Microbacterium terricola]UYK39373.1 cellulase family glycosylhydrolase [Microbacterium terricola]BDV29903.1 endoglucanase [Microbacterium terricola]